MRRRSLLVALPISLFSSSGNAQVRQLELASYFASLSGDEVQRFADRLGERSGGTLRVLCEPQIPTMPLAMIAKASDLAHYDASLHADVERLLALSALPMLAASFDEAELLLQIARPHYDAALARHGQILLATEPARPATMWSTFPIRSAADLKDTRFALAGGRGSLAGSGSLFGWHKPLLRLGGREVRFWEAEMVVVNGNVDGFKFPMEFGCFIELFYAAQLSFLTVSRTVFDQLSEAQRQLLLAEGRAAEQALWRSARNRVQREHREIAQRQVAVVAQAPAELMTALRAAAEPDVEDWARAVGPDAIAILAEYRRAVGRSDALPSPAGGGRYGE